MVDAGIQEVIDVDDDDTVRRRNQKWPATGEGRADAKKSKFDWVPVGAPSKQVEETMKRVISSADITGAHDPERVNREAAKLGLRAGWSMDLTTTYRQGCRWDFSKVHMRNKSFRRVIEEKPLMIIGSLPCADMGQFTHWSSKKMSWEEVQRGVRETEAHVKLCCRLYQLQSQAGRYFLHEHPQGSMCWQMKEMQQLLAT